MASRTRSQEAGTIDLLPMRGLRGRPLVGSVSDAPVPFDQLTMPSSPRLAPEGKPLVPLITPLQPLKGVAEEARVIAAPVSARLSLLGERKSETRVRISEKSLTQAASLIGGRPVDSIEKFELPHLQPVALGHPGPTPPSRSQTGFRGGSALAPVQDPEAARIMMNRPRPLSAAGTGSGMSEENARAARCEMNECELRHGDGQSSRDSG